MMLAAAVDLREARLGFSPEIHSCRRQPEICAVSG